MRNLKIILYLATFLFIFNLKLTSSSDNVLKPANLQFVRPSLQKYYEFILAGNSFFSKRSKIKILNLITTIDKLHLKQLCRTNIYLVEPDDFILWINKKCFPCHTKTPLFEKAILSVFQLQVDMLDQILFKRNAELSDKLRKSRKLIRVRDKTKSIFGDSRDVYICLLMDRLKHISELQQALGAYGNKMLEFSNQSVDKKDIEEDLIFHMLAIKRVAEQLN